MILILIIGVIAVYSLTENAKLWKELESKNTLLEQKQEEVNYFEGKANTRSKLEVIQDEILTAKDIQAELDEDFIEAQKRKEANVWYVRCLELEGQLELSWKDYDLECLPYRSISEGFIFTSQEAYKNLERFASYNIEQTKLDLGL